MGHEHSDDAGHEHAGVAVVEPPEASTAERGTDPTAVLPVVPSDPGGEESWAPDREPEPEPGPSGLEPR
jgi:hypothetical protein